MQPPAPRDEPFAGPQVQVIRVAQDDLRAGVDQLAMRQRLDRPLCPDRHEDRRVDDSVSSVQPPAARRAVGGDEIEAEHEEGGPGPLGYISTASAGLFSSEPAPSGSSG